MNAVGPTTIPLDTIVMTPGLEEGQIRFVLSWPNSPKDLDLHSLFKVSRFTQCEVYFGKRDCGKTNLDTDNFNYGINGVETITINTLGSYVYSIAVHKYIDISDGEADGEKPVDGYVEDKPDPSKKSERDPADLPLMQSDAKISVYIPGYRSPIAIVPVPSKFKNENDKNNAGNDPNKFTWWLAICLDGTKGVNSMVVINEISMNKPDSKKCEQAVKK